MTAHRPTSADAAAPTPTGAALYQMSFIRYHNQFTDLHQQAHFSPNAHLLFNVLLGFFNDRRTDSQLNQIEEFADSFLILATGISRNTFKPARAELVLRRVLAFDDGGRSEKGGRPKKTDMGKYKLLRYREVSADEVPLKLSKIDSLIDSYTRQESGKLSEKLSEELSKFDTNIKKERGTENITTHTARAEKKRGVAEADLPPGRGASHTGGGGPTDVPTSEGLRPLADGETLPGGYVDESLPESDASKYVARPRDAAMVNDWLATNPDEQLRAKVGRGQLFIDYYEQYGWCNKFGRPITNWRATAKQFSFIDYKAEREAEHAARQAKAAAAGGGQLNQRRAGVEDAKARFRNNGQQEGGQNG